MKVAYIHQYFVPPGGTGGTRSWRVAQALTARGHTVTMITSTARLPASATECAAVVDRLRDQGVELVTAPVGYSNRMSFQRRSLAFALFAVWVTAWLLVRGRKRGFDVVLASSTPLTVAIPALASRRLLKIPFVFEVRDLWPDLPIAVGALHDQGPLARIARALECRAYEEAGSVIALSPGMRDVIVGRGVPPERVVVVPNFADLELFRSQETCVPLASLDRVLSRGRTVVYAGSIGPIYGVGYIVDLAVASGHEGCDLEFIVIGDGADRQRVMEMARTRGVMGTSLHFCDPVPKGQLPSILRGGGVALSTFADIPEMWDNSANKFFDALAAGTPIAINYGGWQADLLEAHDAGVVLPVDDPVEGVRRLSALIDDPRRHAQVSTNAWALGEQYSATAMTTAVVDHLEASVATPKGRL